MRNSVIIFNPGRKNTCMGGPLGSILFAMFRDINLLWLNLMYIGLSMQIWDYFTILHDPQSCHFGTSHAPSYHFKSPRIK